MSISLTGGFYVNLNLVFDDYAVSNKTNYLTWIHMEYIRCVLYGNITIVFPVIKSPLFCGELCFQFISAASTAASTAAITFASHLRMIYAKLTNFGIRDI